jgi:hypothetical protein
MKCPKCNAEASGSEKFCRSCGAPLATSSGPAQAGTVCPSCGTAVQAGAKFCVSCAAPLGRAPSSPPAVAAILICVHCGAQAKAGTKFCESCGKAIASSAPAVTPDMMPTAVISTPLTPPAPVGSSPPRMAAQPASPVAGAPPERLAGATPRVQAQRSSGSNRPLIITSVVVFALVAGGLTYRFVLRKPAGQNPASDETPAAVQPAASAPAETSPEAASSEPQVPATTETQPSAEGAPAGTAPAGNAVVPATKVSKGAPTKPAGARYAQAHNNAEQALAASQYVNPPDSSALFWARKAKALGDPGAAEIEQQVFAKQLADITASRQNHNYDQARAQLYQLASNFPDHTELRQMQDDIQQDQQRYTQQMAEQSHQAELQAQTKKFAVQHRHGTGSNSCTGIITVSPDGTAKYDCTTADSGGRCEHVAFGMGSLKEVKLRGDGSLHVASHQQGNFDFTGGDFAVRGAAAALAPLIKR